MKAVFSSVRPAVGADVERIVEIERSWEHLSHWSVDAYYRLLEDRCYTSTLVAETEERSGPKIVGFVIFHTVDRCSEIYNIAVDVRHRRVGVGGTLMRKAIERSRILGAQKLILEVRKSNRRAIEFYTRFQFCISGERGDYYSNPPEDAYVMMRDLRI